MTNEINGCAAILNEGSLYRPLSSMLNQMLKLCSRQIEFCRLTAILDQRRLYSIFSSMRNEFLKLLS